MKRILDDGMTIFALFALMFMVMVGCDHSIRHRTNELKSHEGKTVSETYMLNNNTVVMRFSDGTVLELKASSSHDHPIVINKERE